MAAFAQPWETKDAQRHSKSHDDLELKNSMPGWKNLD